MRVAIAQDHGGFDLKSQVGDAVRRSGHEVIDLGPHQLDLATTTPTPSSPWPRRGRRHG
jgi:ribose 5-phosphate isomerase RpiB